MKINILFAFCVLFLVGCSDSKVELVKKTASIDPNFTMGQIFDHNENCGKVDWKSTKDKNGRDIVSVYCNFKVSTDMIGSAKKDGIELIAKNAEYLISNYQDVESKISLNLEERNRVQKSVNTYPSPSERLAAFLNSSKMTRDEYWRKNLQEQFRTRDMSQPMLDKLADNGIEEERAKTQLILEKEILADKTLDEQIAQRDLDIKNKIESNLNNMRAIKADYFDRILKMKTTDESAFNSFDFNNIKLEQRKFFLVNDNRVQRAGHEFFINGKKIETNIDDDLTMQFGMEAPNDRTLEKKWWQKKISEMINISILKFPYSCTAERGCVLRN